MRLMTVLSQSFLVVITINLGFIVRQLTKHLRGTANAWYFYYALVIVITVLCGELVVALAAP